jgi:hypothetical protein
MSDWILAKLKKLEVVEKNQPVQEVFDDPDDEIPY